MLRTPISGLAGTCLCVLVSMTSAEAETRKPLPPRVAGVEICGEQGDAFFLLPGTQTCLAIGGYVRHDVLTGRSTKGYQNFNDAALWGGDTETAHEGAVIGGGRLFHSFLSATQASLSFDARTATEAGLLRSYMEIHFSNTTYGGATGVEMEKAFAQWGGLVAGRTQSVFDFFIGFDDPVYFAPSVSNRTTNLLAYAHTLGEGTTATLSVEDPAFRRALAGSDSYAGTRYPDIVAALRVDRTWGMVQAMAAYHQNYGEEQSLSAAGPWERGGWAVGVGVMFRLPELGRGDKLWFQAALARGAVDYTGPDPHWYVDFADRSNTGVFQRTDWALTTAFHHGFSKQHAVNLTASLHRSTGWVWRSTFTGANAIYAPNSGDYRQIDLGASWDYKPVKDLTLRFGTEYRRLDYANANNYFNRRPTNVARSSDDAQVFYLRVVHKFGGDDD